MTEQSTEQEAGRERELSARLQAIQDHEGGPRFMGLPDRWYDEGPRYRCINDHVSIRYLKSEARGANVCLACFEPVHMTFPEDEEGPLEHPALSAVSPDPAGER